VPILDRKRIYEDIVEPTSKVVELPAKFEDARGMGRWILNSPSSSSSKEEIKSHEYDTRPAGTWVPIPDRKRINEDIMRPTLEVVEPPAQFEYARGYGQMDNEQPMFHKWCELYLQRIHLMKLTLTLTDIRK
jgi:hypothetical protein